MNIEEITVNTDGEALRIENEAYEPSLPASEPSAPKEGDDSYIQWGTDGGRNLD